MGAFDTIRQTFEALQPDDGIDGGFSVEDFKPTGDNIAPAEVPRFDKNVPIALAGAALDQIEEVA